MHQSGENRGATLRTNGWREKWYNSAMEISLNTVIRFHYRLSDEDGAFSETSRDADPVVYLHGHGGVVRGLEQAMRGRKAGDSFSVTVTPEQGYGERDPEAMKRVPIKHLVRPGKLAAGKAVLVNGKDGHLQATVLKVGRFNVDLDFNHPLAGKTLLFEIDVVDVREATAEEISHGHAHGPGGAHHH